MTVCRALVGLLVAAALAIVCPEANGACTSEQQESMLDGAVQIKTVMHCSPTSSSTTETVAMPPRDSDWDAACVRTALAVALDVAEFCDLPSGASPPSVTPGLVAQAFRRLPLPEAELVIQPPNGRTLVNFETSS